MATAEITKRFRFESAHRLEHHKGKCSRPHGHSYILEVSVRGVVRGVTPGDSSSGMVMDFDDLSKIVRECVIDPYDHQDLNVRVPVYTTAENMALHFFKRIRMFLNARGFGDVTLTKVKLNEMESGWVTVTADDLADDSLPELPA
jgi:6-pyruvoyltetrahydropterin/6-carboxytetrahydropterin synthase